MGMSGILAKVLACQIGKYYITVTDMTYKTTKYDLALFYVSTNVNYAVVVEFVVQSEAAEYIFEAISIIKQWNPKWSPFMTNYSEAE